MFNLTVAIAPDTVISSLFLEPLGFVDPGPFESLGREIGERYGCRKSENVTQIDGVFISEKSIAGVELKLGSAT
ncbi:MAG: hypothetical protein GY788_29060 [bacterium]|nr:hypothetical protein [bacterium]